MLAEVGLVIAVLVVVVDLLAYAYLVLIKKKTRINGVKGLKLPEIENK